MATRPKLAMLGFLSLVVIMLITACAPAATPAAPPPAPTTVPPTEAPTMAPTMAPTATPTEAPAATATPAAPAAKPITLQIASDDKLGKFLADGNGMTLYLFTKDTQNISNCYGKCESAWPPVIPDGQPNLKDGVDAALISTTLRTDGSTQLTYNGWPLYYYFEDTKPGDAIGQAANDVWWVVSGEGNPIKPATLAVTTTKDLGTILVDGDGRTLYMFKKDAKDTTNCYDQCEVAWPPLLTLDTAATGDGVDASLLGTTQRKDGTLQVTYNGMPLYYFLKDQAPGDIAGQGVGSVWYVVAPDGNLVDKD